MSVQLNRCKEGSRLEGAGHKIGCNQTLIRDEGIQHITHDITLTEKTRNIYLKIVLTVCII